MGCVVLPTDGAGVREVIGAPDPAVSLAERDRLEREIGMLPIDQRAVMVVHYYLDQPLSAAAEILEIPVGTAKSRLHHGLAALRRSMGRDPALTDAGTAKERTA